jgi:hypothetical protein
MKYEVNYKVLALLLLPTFLRQSRIVAFLRAVISAVEYCYNRFLGNRKDNLYRLKMNGQVCYLRALLNNAFPEAGGLIRIEEGEIVGDWLWLWDEDYDPYLHYTDITDSGVWLWDETAILESISGFLVYVPHRVFDVNNDAKIRALLNAYKLLSKSYTIIYQD